MTEIKQQIPPILRPDHVAPVSLADLVEFFDLTPVKPLPQTYVTGISMNTGDLRAGDLFVAMPGLKTHGAQFAAKAIELGCLAIITDQKGLEQLADSGLKSSVPVLLLEAPRKHLGRIAAYVYGNLTDSRPKMFATTGTNGKTSTGYFLEAILRQLGETTGLTSTAERHIAGEVIVSRLTTPESTEMNALIARMREKHCTAISIEVSAQALTQLRVDGLYFDAVGFTNLSHDHLDDYADMDEYLAAKAELFVPERATRGVVSLDSEFGDKFAAASKIPVVTITSDAKQQADWKVEILSELPGKTAFRLIGSQGQKLESWVPILGAHMAANAGLAIVMLLQAGYDFLRITTAIEGGIDAYLPGRTELVSGDAGPAVYVDFGHSPDAFLNTLAAVRKVTSGKVLMLFGADGDRDATKRAEMARIAAQGSDILVITDHHPRFEDPASIRKTLFDAAKNARPEMPLFEVSPPEAAIRKAVSLVGEGDAVLWAGPGHQDYRDIRGVRTPYSARQEARDALKEAGWS
jgi:UDP-N-acetylmuramoyl-L-alanyl-D-glutamate--2,6-diaminopimelate ligase